MTSTDITPLVVVTGPTRGLGRDLVLALARRKTRLILLGRDRTAVERIAAEAREAGAPVAEGVTLDLASFASIGSSAMAVNDVLQRLTLGPITAVVANAGIQMGNRHQTTDDGLETTFGVNVVGNYLLLKTLRPYLAADTHIVVVGSGTHFGDPMTKLVVAAPNWDTPEHLAAVDAANGGTAKAGQCAYSTSKLGVNYLVHELNRRWGSPMRANVYDPGLMPGTGLARDLPRVKQWAWNHIMPALKVLPGVASTQHSAEKLARLTLGEEHGGIANAYIEIGKLSKASEASNNPRREKELWEYCEHITTKSQTN